jgi:hypothetical protein
VLHPTVGGGTVPVFRALWDGNDDTGLQFFSLVRSFKIL